MTGKALVIFKVFQIFQFCGNHIDAKLTWYLRKVQGHDNVKVMHDSMKLDLNSNLTVRLYKVKAVSSANRVFQEQDKLKG